LVVRVVLQDVTAVAQAEHVPSGPPDLGPDALLLGHHPSEAVSHVKRMPLDAAVVDGLERLVRALPSDHAVRATDALI
jgi:hypothetical protein